MEEKWIETDRPELGKLNFPFIGFLLSSASWFSSLLRKQKMFLFPFYMFHQLIG